MKFILLSLLLFLIFVQVHSNDDEKLIRLIIKSQKEVELVQNFIQNNVSYDLMIKFFDQILLNLQFVLASPFIFG